MALEFNDLLKLAKIITKADKEAYTTYSFGEKKYSYDELYKIFKSELTALASDYRTYRKNQNIIFDLIWQTIYGDW